MMQKLLEKFASARAVIGLVWLHTDRFVKGRLLLAVGLLVLTSVLTSLGPVALKYVVDAIAGEATLRAADIDPSARGETLSVADFVRLANASAVPPSSALRAMPRRVRRP